MITPFTILFCQLIASIIPTHPHHDDRVPIQRASPDPRLTAQIPAQPRHAEAERSQNLIVGLLVGVALLLAVLLAIVTAMVLGR